MMLSKKILLAATCAGTMVMAGNALAADTVPLTVVADVQGICKFQNSSYSMIFGQLDPSSASDAVMHMPVNYFCTKGTAATSIKISGGDSGTTVDIGSVTPGGSIMPVKMEWTTPSTLGSGFAPSGTPINVDFKGTIAAASISAAVAGRYVGRGNISILP
jgi:hypothetical protein